MSTGAFPGPLRQFLAQLDELRSRDILDMEQVGRLLAGLAADEEYLGPLIAEIPAESPSFDLRIGLKSSHWDDAPSCAVIDSNCVGLTGPGAWRRGG